jgi:hypothetical protein
MRTFSWLCLLAFVAYASSAHATLLVNDHEQIGFDRPEAWAMKYFTTVTLMTGMGPPRPLHLGSLRLAADAEWIPEVSDAQRVVGFNGTASEDMNKLPALGRLRFSVGLGWKLSLTLSYLPPISIAGVEPNLFSLSLGRPFALGRNFTLGVLTYGQVGSVEGSFTCSAGVVRAGPTSPQNPLGCLAPSHDHVDMNYLGLELSASYRIAPAHNLEPYVSVAANYMNLGFQVGAHYGDDVVDFTHLSTQGATFSTTGGLLYPITPRLDVATELFYSPLTVARPQNDGATTVEGLFNVRGMIAYRFF